VRGPPPRPRQCSHWRRGLLERLPSRLLLGPDDPRHPYDAEPVRGRAAIVEDWRGDRDEPGSWDAAYEVALIEGDRAIAKGETVYSNGTRFSNLWELRFDADGRCVDYVEWYMEHPA
jgi:hypothetical protein